MESVRVRGGALGPGDESGTRDVHLEAYDECAGSATVLAPLFYRP